MAKPTRRRPPRSAVPAKGRVSAAELRELEARIRSGAEKGVAGEAVMLETMRELAKRRRA